MLQRSRFVEKRAEDSSILTTESHTDAREAASTAAAAIAGIEIEPHTFDEYDGELEENDDDEPMGEPIAPQLVDVEPGPNQKRQRTARTTFVPPPAVVSKRKATGKATGSKGCKSTVVRPVTANINPRTGRVYSRGPYKQPHTNPATESATFATTNTLQQELESKSKRIRDLEKQLDALTASSKDKLDACKHQTTALMRLELHHQYMLGLQHGSTLAQGESISLAPMPPSSACSGSMSGMSG